MTDAALARAHRTSRPALGESRRGIASWPRAPWARLLRAALQRLILFPIVHAFCRPLRVSGRERIPEGPVVFVANHASHADTAALLRALPRRRRARTAPAAAEDYFFTGRVRGAVVSLVMGAFPFPRRGADGLERAAALLARGESVLLFPEGTREGGRFRPGAALLARDGATIVPVGIAGTADVLPKGRVLPRCAPVALAFGTPVRVPRGADLAHANARLEARVRRLARAAELARAPRICWHARAAALARSRRGVVLAFAWGFAESLFFPIVPDVAVALLALAAPGAFLRLGIAAAAGSVTGGALAWWIGALGAAPPMLLVTPRMHATAADWLASDGAGAMWRQPWSGIPYKVFGYQAADAGVALGPFAWATLLARGARLLEVGVAFALVGRAGRRVAPRAWGAASVVFTVLFGFGLARVVVRWS